MIEGDDAVCQAENLDDGIDTNTGIVNCDEADGTPDRPYEISGWSIHVSSMNGELPGAPRCKNSDYTAAVNICHVSHAINLRNMDIQYPYFHNDGDDTLQPAGVHLSHTNHSHIENVKIESGGLGVHIRGDSNEPTTDVTLKDVEVRALVDDPPWSLLTLIGYDLEEPLRGKLNLFPMLEVVDADVNVLDSHIDATLRTHAIRVHTTGPPDGGEPLMFRMEGSLVENSVQTGLGVQNVAMELHRNTFRNNSYSTAFVFAEHPFEEQHGTMVDTGGANVALSSMSFNITRNRFQIPGQTNTAILIETDSPGRIEQNRFNQETSRGIAVNASPGSGCNTRITYNDLNRLHVRNNDDSCTLLARWNWWGSENGPSGSVSPDGEQASGPVDSDQWLKRPLDDLPVVTIDRPRPDAAIHRWLALRGSTHAPTENPLTHNEATIREGDWTQTTNTSGTDSWKLTWDLSNTPRGPLSFWVRGCGEHECGVPQRLDIRHVPIPPVPIAVITATPEVAQVGETVRLDATRSYSPEGGTIVSYRFHGIGDRWQDWIEQPTIDVVFDSPGSHSVSASVKDEDGLENRNGPQIVVRVLPQSAQTTGSREILPAPGLAALLLVGAIAAIALRRRS